MVHISPWAAALGLMTGSAALLGSGAPLILYGPYLDPEVPTAPSNLDFDANLCARNPDWGLRDLERVKAAAIEAGLVFAERDRKSPRLNSSHYCAARMPFSACNRHTVLTRVGRNTRMNS